MNDDAEEEEESAPPKRFDTRTTGSLRERGTVAVFATERVPGARVDDGSDGGNVMQKVLREGDVEQMCVFLDDVILV